MCTVHVSKLQCNAMRASSFYELELDFIFLFFMAIFLNLLIKQKSIIFWLRKSFAFNRIVKIVENLSYKEKQMLYFTYY